MEHSDYPVKVPLITDVLARAIHAEMTRSERKRFAFPTRFRHSDAGKCGRYLWYESQGVEQSNPPDVGSAYIMWLGTMLHEELQRALPERFPNAKVELPVRIGDLSSGHLDARLILTEDFTFADGTVWKAGTVICYELKTRGSFGFDKAVGWRRKNWAVDTPEGPSTSDRIQGALNAVAIDADVLIIGMLALEAASKGFADKHGIDDVGRICAEWQFDKAEFAPWAADEIARMKDMDAGIAAGVKLPRTAIGDEMDPVKLNPNANKPSWQCSYCSHFDTCKGDD
jgi:hypothetical protein